MGEPDDATGYTRLDGDDMTVYLAADIWQRVGPRTKKLLVAIEGYGRFWLYLDRPATGTD